MSEPFLVYVDGAVIRNAADRSVVGKLTFNTADPYALASQTQGEGEPDKDSPTVVIGYTNWRGEYAEREIVPMRPWFGSTEWHPEPQWLLTAWDVAKDAERDFAIKDIGFLTPSPTLEPTDAEVKQFVLNPLHIDLLNRGVKGQFIWFHDRADLHTSEMYAVGQLCRAGLARMSEPSNIPGPPCMPGFEITDAGRAAIIASRQPTSGEGV